MKKNILLILVSITLTLGVLELLCRTIYFFQTHTWQAADATYKSDPHPMLLYTSKRNFNGLLPAGDPGSTFRVRINAHGFRTHELYPKIPGVYRVLLLGDSFVWGYNANQEDTLGVRIEALLHQRGKTNAEVIALAAPSYSCLRYAVLARSYFAFLQPDLVIVCVDQSDIKEDEDRVKDYLFDAQGAPTVLKDAEKIMSGHVAVGFAFDVNRTLCGPI